MRADYTARFQESYNVLPERVRLKFQKQVKLLIQNLRYPSLRAKKYDEARDIWQARVDKKYRFYFKIKGKIYLILDITAHPK